MPQSNKSSGVFGLLLGQGLFSGLGFQLSGTSLVLPFVFTALGGPIFVAGLLALFSRGATLAGNFLCMPVLESARRHKWHIAAAFLVSAMALGLICLFAADLPVSWLAAGFLGVVVVGGLAGRLSDVAVKDLLGRELPDEHRRNLLFIQSALVGLLAIGVALASQRLVDSGSAIGEHIELLWVGVGMFVLAAVITAAVQERERHSRRDTDNCTAGARKGQAAQLRDDFISVFRLPWLPRFLVAGALFLAIELALPFFPFTPRPHMCTNPAATASS